MEVSNPDTTRQVVLVIDDQETFAIKLGRSFRNLGFTVWLGSTLQEAHAVCDTSPPDLIVTELRLEGRFAFDFIETMRQKNPSARAVIATSYPSVASAVEAMRFGFDGYVAKPAEALNILELAHKEKMFVAEATPESPQWPSLDRTIWEYINQVFVTAGTMSEAARRLGLDRRSLRRMLAKYPPMR